ncbi:MAG: ribonuclease P protein component [Flammeovirgaceae bacterium]|jgi:ribonuclease P protein component|nr:ribonuclease P protein component [Flammeovirgaceae bacterium]|tara:strand:+ start:72938 stop:73333 length:396 start_codon:yes stop_codon:yes gene_type:complete
MSVSALSKPSYTFSKSERLHSKRKIEELFKKGSSFNFKFFRVILLLQPLALGKEVLISVPKKRHKLAVDRNRIKRLIREFYRQNKQLVASPSNGYLMAILYISPQMPTYEEVVTQLTVLFNRLPIDKASII